MAWVERVHEVNRGNSRSLYRSSRSCVSHPTVQCHPFRKKQLPDQIGREYCSGGGSFELSKKVKVDTCKDGSKVGNTDDWAGRG